MFDRWALSFCCSPESQITLQVELLSHHNLHGYQHSRSDSNHCLALRNCNAQQSNADLSGYYFYIFAEINQGDILKDQDFLYVSKPLQRMPVHVDELDPDFIMGLALNRFNSTAAFCNFHLRHLAPLTAYQIYFFRKHAVSGKLTCLHKTKKFKIIPQEASIDEASVEFALIYETESAYLTPNNYYVNFQPVTQHKYAKSLIETSGKTGKSLLNDSKNTEQRYNRNSFFNSTLPYSEANTFSYNHTNKNSVYENVYSTHNGSKTGSFAELRRSPNPQIYRSPNTLARDQVDVSNYNPSKDESIINVNETFIINDNPENDDYVKKICSILSENLSNHPTGMHDSSVVMPLAIARARSKNQNSSQPIDLKTSKIYQLIKSQEQKRCASGQQEKVKNRLKDLEDSPSLFTSNRKPKCYSLLIDSYGSEKENLNPKLNSMSKGDKKQSSSKKAGRQPLSERTDLFHAKNTRNVQDNIPNERNEQSHNMLNSNSSYYNFLNEQRPNLFDPFLANDQYSSNEKEIIVETLDEMNEVDEVEMAESSSDLNHHNTPRSSIRVSGTLSEKQLTQSANSNTEFSFTANFKEVYSTQSRTETFGPETTKNDHYQESDSNRATPRLTNVDFKTMYIPTYCDRLYTVEEVCSPDKEGSNGGNMNFKASSSRSPHKSLKIHNINNTSSMRLKTSEFGAVNELNEYEYDSIMLKDSPNWHHLSSRESENEKDFQNELLMIASRFESLGLAFECSTADCLFRVKESRVKGIDLTYRWYPGIQEHDLSTFFEDIYLSLKNKMNNRAQHCDYI